MKRIHFQKLLVLLLFHRLELKKGNVNKIKWNISTIQYETKLLT